jgi:predicted metal-dependent HD superfamily phosphohydrolase
MDAVYKAFDANVWNKLVAEAITVASVIIDEGWEECYSYHNAQHTKSVIESVNALAVDAALDEEDRAVLLVAAAFHDSGYFTDCNNHENLGATFAADFLISRKVRVDLIGKVVHLIQSTALHVRPVNHLQELLRDADLHYLGCDNFILNANQLKSEWEVTKNLTYSTEAWLRQNLRFLKNHRFHSNMAQRRYDRQKQVNIAKLQTLLEATTC